MEVQKRVSDKECQIRVGLANILLLEFGKLELTQLNGNPKSSHSVMKSVVNGIVESYEWFFVENEIKVISCKENDREAIRFFWENNLKNEQVVSIDISEQFVTKFAFSNKILLIIPTDQKRHNYQDDWFIKLSPDRGVSYEYGELVEFFSKHSPSSLQKNNSPALI